jgi:hypothetical protein
MSDDPAPSPFRDTAGNLLFGLLALQNSFISRDALVAAFGTWVTDKSKPLDRILLDQGHLDNTAMPCSRAWSASTSSCTATTRRGVWPTSVRWTRRFAGSWT